MTTNIKDYLHFYYGQQVVFFESGDLYFLTAKVLVEWDQRYKLVLRPLSDMTKDEEKYEGKLEMYHSSSKIIQCRREAERTCYLLLKHFDLFGLIDAGLAIDATKHHQSKMRYL